MRQINDAWINGRTDELVHFIDEAIVMALPGFAQSISGREAFIEGFAQFGHTARIESMRESEHAVFVVGTTGIVTFPYEMIYERSGDKWRSSGRDLWVFAKQDGAWKAVWRTMLDVAESKL